MSTTTEGVDPKVLPAACRKDKDGRKCYAVKVCIEKSPRHGSKPRSTCQAGDGNTLLLPPFNGQLQHVCCKPRRRNCSTNSRKCDQPRIRETREFHTDTQSDQWECKSKCDKIGRQCQTDTANKSCQKIFTESHCQTINGEVKQCGLQTSAMFTTCTKECQTDVDRACNAVGEAHNRKCCTKPCCKANNNTRCNTTSKNRYPHNHEFNQISCERKHVFPFIGRTPSGNLKIHPNMISYEHREFGVLVANPASIHTRVEKLTARCEKDVPVSCPQPVQLKPFPAPPTPPPPPRNCYPKENSCRPAANSFYSDRQHPAPSFLKEEDYATSSSPHPAPPFSHENRSNFSNSPRENCNCHGRIPEPIKPDCCNKIDDSYRFPQDQDEYRNNGRGHIDEWTYVNPSYLKKQPQSSRGDETEFSAREIDHNSQGKGRSTDRNSDGVRHQSAQTSINPFEEHLKNGMQESFEPNDMKGNYSYSEGSHKSELLRGKQPSDEKKYSDDHHQRAPYTPPFPKRKEEKDRMSDSEHRTPIESEATDVDESSCGCAKSVKSEKPHCHRHHHHHHRSHKTKSEDEMVGKLHYLLHGEIAQNTTIKIGDTEYPITSVVFEIQSKVIQPVKHHVPEDIVKDVILPDLNELPHKYVYDKTLTLENTESESTPVTYEHEPLQENEKMEEDQQQLPTILVDTVQDEPETEEPESDESDEPEPEPQPEPEPPTLAPPEKMKKRVTVVVENDSETDLMNFSLKNPDPVETSSPVIMPADTKDTVFKIVESNYNTSHQAQHEPEPKPLPHNISSVATNLTASPSAMETPKTIMRRSSNINEERQSSVLLNLDTQRGAVLVVGGINPKLPCGPGNTGRDIFMYTIDADMWTHVGVLPHSRAHFGLARIDTFIYVVGGSDPEQKDPNGKNLPVQSNLRLNLRTGEWDALPELEIPRSHFGCVALNQKIYIIGGNVDSRASSSCLVFNIDNRSWNPITPLDTTRSNMGIAVLDNKILVAGGTSKSAKRPVLETVVLYDPDLDSWTAWKSLPTPRAFCSLGIVAGKIYLVGGAGIKDLSKRRNTSLAEIIRYEDVIKEWVEVASLYNPRHGHASAVSGDNILIVGGVSSHFMGPLSSVEVFSAVRWDVRNGTSLSNSYSGTMAVTI